MIFLKGLRLLHSTGFLSVNNENIKGENYVKISVVVSLYNVEQYATECLESLKNQSFKDFEAILVDDGSTDKTAEIIDRYAELDSRFKAFHKQNGGPVSARKFGTKIAQGDYVLPVDGDDRVHSCYLEKFSNLIEKYHADIYISGFEKCDDNGEMLTKMVPREGEAFYSKEDIVREILPGLMDVIPMVWSKAFKKELFMKYQMMVDDRISMGEDGVVTFSCIANAESMCVFGACDYCYRVNNNSITRSKKKYIPLEGALLRIRMLEKTLPIESEGIFEQLSAYVAHSLFNVARSNLKFDNFGKVKKDIGKAINDPEITEYLKVACKKAKGKERLAAGALYRHYFLLIKLFSLVD